MNHSIFPGQVELCEDNNPYGENAFALFTRRRSFFLIARSVKERDVWIEVRGGNTYVIILLLGRTSYNTKQGQGHGL